MEASHRRNIGQGTRGANRATLTFTSDIQCFTVHPPTSNPFPFHRKPQPPTSPHSTPMPPRAVCTEHMHDFHVHGNSEVQPISGHTTHFALPRQKWPITQTALPSVSVPSENMSVHFYRKALGLAVSAPHWPPKHNLRTAPAPVIVSSRVQVLPRHPPTSFVSLHRTDPHAPKDLDPTVDVMVAPQGTADPLKRQPPLADDRDDPRQERFATFFCLEPGQPLVSARHKGVRHNQLVCCCTAERE